MTRQKRGLMQKLLTGEWRVNAADFCHPDLTREEIAMPLPGGPADKFGNRYEHWWTVLQLVRVIDGQAA